ncbi:MAG: UDP-4-amino-4,6-dideoxy-N-acetyl-beta-L-altrosamine transaminase [bacterium]
MIPYARQNIDKEDVEAVLNTLTSDFITTGPIIGEFEEKLCKLTGVKHAVVCSNGTAALHLACLALGISKNDLGLTSAITFPASANCIEFCGGRADFIDIDTGRLCLSPDELESYCKNIEVPKVVIPVDFAGVPADLPRIWNLAQKYGFKVIEDAAHSIGSAYTFQGTEYQCGSCKHSDLAIFSFHPVKNITTGEGGAVLTNNDRLAERARLFASHGIQRNHQKSSNSREPWFYEMIELGYNFRITDIQCALGISQLNKLNKFKKKKLEVFKKYNKAFKNIRSVDCAPWPANTSPHFHLYVLRVNQDKLRRIQLYNKLLKINVKPQIHYIPVYWQPYYRKKYGYKVGKCPKSECYYSRCLSLPFYSSLNRIQIEFVISKIKEYSSNL